MIGVRSVWEHAGVFRVIGVGVARGQVRICGDITGLVVHEQGACP